MTGKPTIEFYSMAESPYCRAVEMVAKVVGVTLNKHPINLFAKEQLKEDFVKLNPLHKVPFIVDGELKLGESRAISAYLVNKYLPKDSTLYPKDPVERARVDEALYIDATLLSQAQGKLLGPLIFGTVKVLNAEDEKAYRVVLQYFNERLHNNKGKKFLLGDNLTIADITFAATFSSAEACSFDLSEYKYLEAYLKNLKASIPDYELINGKAMETMKKLIKSRQ